MSISTDLSTERKAGRPAGAWRGAGRFSLVCDLSFRRSGEHGPVGKGRTVNMSSTGALFRTNQQLKVADELELTLKWPVQSGWERALDLNARGRVVREQRGLVAVYFTKCGFFKAAVPER